MTKIGENWLKSPKIMVKHGQQETHLEVVEVVVSRMAHISL
jgi:hypothetical protein